jgi:hypothetical protein
MLLIAVLAGLTDRAIPPIGKEEAAGHLGTRKPNHTVSLKTSLGIHMLD